MMSQEQNAVEVHIPPSLWCVDDLRHSDISADPKVDTVGPPPSPRHKSVPAIFNAVPEDIQVVSDVVFLRQGEKRDGAPVRNPVPQPALKQFRSFTCQRISARGAEPAVTTLPRSSVHFT